MAKSHLKLVAPGTVNRTVRPTRLPNADLRTREYLTEAEVERLLRAIKANRWAHRDATMILVAYRHGLDQLPRSAQLLIRSSDDAPRIEPPAGDRWGFSFSPLATAPE